MKMTESFCAMISKAAFALLLVNCAMLFVVERGSAEQVITVLSIAMMAVLFTLSTAKLRKISKMSGETAHNIEEKETKNEKED